MTRLMGVLFGLGALGFVLGPLDFYAHRVGANADSLTFFIASILFTAGGFTQTCLAWPERRAHRPGRLAWNAAWIQSVGTLLFNVATFAALSATAVNRGYDADVWAPNALGSACFLLSGVCLYLSAPRAGWRPLRRADGWWEPPINLLGCLLFGVSAIAGVAVGSPGRLLNLATMDWTTALGAGSFLAVGLAALGAGMTFRIPRRNRIVVSERALERMLTDAEHELSAPARRLGHDAARSLGAAGFARGPAAEAQSPELRSI